MSGQGLRIVPYAGHKGYQCYLDGWKVNGKRKRLYFKDEVAAAKKLGELAKQQKKEGQAGLNVPLGSCARRRVRTAINRPRHNDTRILEPWSENPKITAIEVKNHVFHRLVAFLASAQRDLLLSRYFRLF